VPGIQESVVLPYFARFTGFSHWTLLRASTPVTHHVDPSCQATWRSSKFSMVAANTGVDDERVNPATRLGAIQFPIERQASLVHAVHPPRWNLLKEQDTSILFDIFDTGIGG
jgi:hypothetical protein